MHVWLDSYSRDKLSGCWVLLLLAFANIEREHQDLKLIRQRVQDT